MIKNTILSLTLIFSLILTKANAQVSVNIPGTNSDNQAESIIIQHKDVKITVGDLEIYAPFIYEGEVAPRQGYLIGIRDAIRMKDIVTGCQSSCDSLVNIIKNEYELKLSQCQSSCNERVKIITLDNDLLKKKNKDLLSNLKSEKRSKIIWATISAVSGAGLGILIYEISK